MSTKVAPAKIRALTSDAGNVSDTRLLFTRLTRVIVVPAQTTLTGAVVGWFLWQSHGVVRVVLHLVQLSPSVESNRLRHASALEMVGGRDGDRVVGTGGVGATVGPVHGG